VAQLPFPLDLLNFIFCSISCLFRMTVVSVRSYATDDVVPAPAQGGLKAQNPKLTQIADSIASLTLLETADLVGILKVLF